MSAEVSIVIVSYNSRRHLPRCIDSLREHTQGVNYEIIVVDNASRDGSAAFVSESYPSVRVVARKTNGGYAAGINEGVRASLGRFIFVINPDTHIYADVASTLAASLRDRPDAGVVAPRLLDNDGTLQLSCRAFPGYTTALFNRYSFFTRVLPSNRFSRDYLMSDFDHASPRDVDWVSGAAIMFPRAVFDAVGGWDTGFFMFNEDVDFCRRVTDAGYRIVYQPEATVYHAIGVSKNPNVRLIVERHTSMWRYYRKHLRNNVAIDVLTAAAIAARCALLLGQHGAKSAVTRLRR